MINSTPYTSLTKLYEPIQKLIDLNVNKFEESIAAQTKATQTFVELADERIQAATEIKDFDGLAAFLNEQAEIARTNLEKLAEESKAATEEMVAYGNEIQKIFNESISSETPAAKPARKAAAKK